MVVLCLLLFAKPLTAEAEVSKAKPFSLKLQPATVQRGDAARVVVTGSPRMGLLEVTLGERTFPLSPVGTGAWEGFVGIDRDAEPGAAMLILRPADPSEATSGVPLATATLVVTDRKFPEQHLTVDESKVTLSEADQARAAAERTEILAALAGRTPEKLWRMPFLYPTDGRISGEFGVRRFYNGKKKSYHSGLDIASPRGTPVLASSEGVVVLTGDYFYTGLTVFIDHGGGLHTAYFHMEHLDVRQGESVEGGDVVGRVGSTGRSTGAHLHWGVYVSGVKVDPVSLVRVTGTADGAVVGEEAKSSAAGKTP